MDSLEQRYNRLKNAVQQAILQNFPNPERKGCPGDEVLREVAGRRRLVEDAAWQHITHCSPCYATFLEYKDEIRRERRKRGLFILVGGVVAACVLIVVSAWWAGVFPGRRAEQAAIVAENWTVDLYNGGVQGGCRLQRERESARPKAGVQGREILHPF